MENEGDDKKKIQNEITGMFEHIFDRILDNNSYVRTKLFTVLTRVCDIQNVKFPKQRLKMTSLAVMALEDKASTVRKAALSLIIRLLETHPYGHMHGGLLQRDAWMKDYEDANKQLAKVESLGDAVANTQEEEETQETQPKKKKYVGF